RHTFLLSQSWIHCWSQTRWTADTNLLCREPAQADAWRSRGWQWRWSRDDAPQTPGSCADRLAWRQCVAPWAHPDDWLLPPESGWKAEDKVLAPATAAAAVPRKAPLPCLQ